jgi:hypothetical protein
VSTKPEMNEYAFATANGLFFGTFMNNLFRHKRNEDYFKARQIASISCINEDRIAVYLKQENEVHLINRLHKTIKKIRMPVYHTQTNSKNIGI